MKYSLNEAEYETLPYSTVNSEIFARFILAKSIKSRIWDIKDSRLGRDLAISVDDRVILLFRELFLKKFRENKTLAKKSELTASHQPNTRHWRKMRSRKTRLF